MIYLAKHQLLFFKPKKVAGTSIEIALSCCATAGSDDIITPLHDEDEAIRQEAGGVAPQNYCYEDSDKLKYYNHIPPDQVIRKMPTSRYRNAYKVTAVRHPLEQLISQAYFQYRGIDDISVDAFNAKVWEILNSTYNYSMYYFNQDNSDICDFYIRFEHLQEDIAALKLQRNIDIPLPLLTTKNTYRKDRRPASEILSKEQIEYCMHKHQHIIRRFYQNHHTL